MNLQKESLYTKANIEKYSSLDKQALIKKAILADYIIRALKYIVELLRPYSWLFITRPKLRQIFDMVSELVRTG